MHAAKIEMEMRFIAPLPQAEKCTRTTEKKFKPLKKQLAALMGGVMKLQKGSIVLMKTVPPFLPLNLFFYLLVFFPTCFCTNS